MGAASRLVPALCFAASAGRVASAQPASWQFGPSMATPRSETHATVAGGCIYVAGGARAAGWRTPFAPAGTVERLCR